MIFQDEGVATLYLSRWQKTLKLQDWDIVPQIKRGRDMDLPDNAACISYKLGKRMAILQLLDPVDWESEVWKLDHEFEMVHELLHLHTAPFAPEGDNVVEEQAINAIAYALIALRREFDG